MKSQRRSLSSRHNNRPQTVSPPTNSTWRRLPIPVLLEHNASASAGSSGGSSAAPHLKELTVFLFPLFVCSLQRTSNNRTGQFLTAELFSHLSADFVVFSAHQMFSSGFCSAPKPQTKDTEPAVCCNPPRSSCDPVAPQASAGEVKTLQVICQGLKQLTESLQVGEQSDRSESSRRAAGGKNNSEEVNPRSTRVKIPSQRWTAACFPVIVSTLPHFPSSRLRLTDLLLLYADDEPLILLTHQKSSQSLRYLLAVKVFSRFTRSSPSFTRRRFGVQTDRWPLWFLQISPFPTRWHRRDVCWWTQTPARRPRLISPAVVKGYHAEPTPAQAEVSSAAPYWPANWLTAV